MSATFMGDCSVLENRKLARDTYLLRLAASELAAGGRPGMFVMVRTGPDPEKGGSPLLKRPFGLHRIGPDGEVSLLYRVVGVGTGLLSQVRPGEKLEILGPLGHGFDTDVKAASAYLVGGGMGLAPLLALAEDLHRRGVEVTVFYGEREGAYVLAEDHLALFPGRMVVTTEDGAAGRQGLVTAPLAEALAAQAAPVLACGPKPMLAAVAGIANEFCVPCQVSLEASMACGMGACLGCVTSHAQGGYRRVCVEGPVFEAEEIKW